MLAALRRRVSRGYRLRRSSASPTGVQRDICGEPAPHRKAPVAIAGRGACGARIEKQDRRLPSSHTQALRPVSAGMTLQLPPLELHV
jgi:hypothetical protein